MRDQSVVKRLIIVVTHPAPKKVIPHAIYNGKATEE